MNEHSVIKNQGASKRMEALADGIFAIAATLLVLEIRVPEIDEGTSKISFQTLKVILPSFVAFIFSFLNILIFWVNHDYIGQVLKGFDLKLTYQNIFFLLFITLIPFTTAFVSRHPFDPFAVFTYGVVLLLSSLMAAIMYYHIAFKSKLMDDKITLAFRKKFWKKVRMGPMLFAIAVLLGWINVIIPITIYILVPIIFLAMPKIEFDS